MAVDLPLLQILKHKEEYAKVINRVPLESLDNSTQKLLKDIGKYFEKFPTHKKVDIRMFASMFRTWHPKLTKDEAYAYATIMKMMNKDLPEEDVSSVMANMMELRLSSDVADLLRRWEAGEVPNIHADLDNLSVQYARDAKIKGLSFLTDPISDLLEQEVNDDGIRFRLACLNNSMRGLRGGDFGIVAGRPDKGKTTFLTSELSFMATQTSKPIVWLNNEGPGNRIRPRLYQAALGLPMSGLIKLHQAGKLIQSYEEAVKGDQHKIRVFDIHGQDTYAVERIIEENEPAIVCYDMIDNVRGFGDAARTDLALEKMYQWGRDMAVKYDAAGIATSQISADGAGLQFPQDHMLKDSKTGKQGACDFILMIGASDDPGYERSRFIGLPKNKLRREGGDNDPKAMVTYKPEIARYEDAAMIDEEEE